MGERVLFAWQNECLCDELIEDDREHVPEPRRTHQRPRAKPDAMLSAALGCAKPDPPAGRRLEVVVEIVALVLAQRWLTEHGVRHHSDLANPRRGGLRELTSEDTALCVERMS